MNQSFVNSVGRLECAKIEFHCGDVVEVFQFNQWVRTRVEHNSSKGGWYSVDGFKIVGNPIKLAGTN